jgi:hypothetical protein
LAKKGCYENSSTRKVVDPNIRQPEYLSTRILVVPNIHQTEYLST